VGVWGVVLVVCVCRCRGCCSLSVCVCDLLIYLHEGGGPHHLDHLCLLRL